MPQHEGESAPQRLVQWIAGSVKLLLAAALFLFLAAYILIATWGELKASCVGQFFSWVFSGSEEEPDVQLRALDPDNNADDHKLGLALGIAANAGGLELDAVRVGVVVSDDANAASFGNGRFLLFEGLHRFDSSALLGIMAHEVAHDVLQHSEETAGRRGVLDTAMDVVGIALGTSHDGRAEVKSVARDLVLPSYSREQELEADQKAIDILVATGMTAESAAQLLAASLQKLMDQHGDRGGGFFDSHPATSERIRILLARRDTERGTRTR